VNEEAGLPLDSAIAEFLALLESGALERDLQAFLAAHIQFWNGIVRLTGGSPLYQKVRLGSEHEMDFVYMDTSSNGAEWHIIEIEPGSARLFNRRGRPTAELTQAIGQVRDWQRWIEINRAYADRLMPGIDHPMGHIFIGRRAEIDSPAGRERLRSMNISHRNYLEIHTLDRFVSMARSAASLARLTVPAQALSDRSLRRGLPAGLEDWIRSPFGSQRLFIDDRIGHVHYDEDYDLR
jgi:Domain of unknown function (DUF4263)